MTCVFGSSSQYSTTTRTTHTFTTIRNIKRVSINTPQGIPHEQFLQTLIREEWGINNEI